MSTQAGVPLSPLNFPLLFLSLSLSYCKKENEVSERYVGFLLVAVPDVWMWSTAA